MRSVNLNLHLLSAYCPDPLLNNLLVLLLTIVSLLVPLGLLAADWCLGTFYVNDKAKQYCKDYSAHLKVIVT